MSAHLADSLFDAATEADRLAGANTHLMEDPILCEVVEFACNGRHTADFDLVVGDPFQATARVLPAVPTDPARYPHEARPANDGRTNCDRCSRPFIKDYTARAQAHSRRDGEQHTLWIAAGSVVVEVVVCTDCRRSLSEDFAPIEWR